MTCVRDHTAIEDVGAMLVLHHPLQRHCSRRAAMCCWYCVRLVVAYLAVYMVKS